MEFYPNMYVNVAGNSGTYSCSGELTKKGLEWEANYYDEDTEW